MSDLLAQNHEPWILVMKGVFTLGTVYILWRMWRWSEGLE
jgi:hypothetical protein